MQRFKHYKWKFKKATSIYVSLYEESIYSLIKNLIKRYQCSPDDIDVIEEGEELPSGQIIWQLKI